MNQLYLSGSLKKYRLLLLVLVSMTLGNTTRDKQVMHIRFRNITGDTVEMAFRNKFILTVINEPACTGCKVNLLQHMKTRSRIGQLYLLDWQYDIVNRKNYRNYIHELNSKATDAYPLADKESTFMLNDSIIHLDRENSPYQLWITMHKNAVSIKKVAYKDIFESINIRDEYFESLERF